jgi:lipopolysaccharide transport system ATP-binding protein
MSAQPAISVHGLGKRYALGQLTGGYKLLTETLADRLASLRGRGPERSDDEEFWALRDIDFEVQQGETFGIVGHNGAGKSTLLKILSRVTPPTTGEAHLRGRVGALLEVGTGFHPELTGRENVFLNGAILGMSRQEIMRKFEEIVDFAGVERFIDTPVKRYSSGMQLRLAFAVAAHLEPEILIVDEVLSVGDLAFQEKCLGRMEAVAGEGRTVLFVSHNLAAVRNLCPRAMLLSQGREVIQGPTDDVIQEYIETVRIQAATHLGDRTDREGSGDLRFQQVSFEADGRPIDTPASGQDFEIVLSYEAAPGTELRDVNFAVTIYTHLGEVMLNLPSEVTGSRTGVLPAAGQARCRIPRCPLPAGQYGINVWADRGGQPLDWVQRASEITVIQGDFFGTGREPPEAHRSVYVDYDWSIEAGIPDTVQTGDDSIPEADASGAHVG